MLIYNMYRENLQKDGEMPQCNVMEWQSLIRLF